MFSLAHLSFWIAALVAGVSATGSFLEPSPHGEPGVYTDDATFEIGQNIKLQWTTDLSTMDIVVFQQHPATNPWVVKVVEQSLTDERETTWEVDLTGFDLPDGEDMVFFFGVAPEPTPTAGNWLPANMDSTSGYFNVSLPVTTRTTNLPTASQTQTPAVQVVSHKLSKGATAGIAVGVIGAVLISGGLGFLIGSHFRKNKDQNDPEGELLGADIDKIDVGDSLRGVVEVPAQNPIHEVPGRNQEMAQELPTPSDGRTR